MFQAFLTLDKAKKSTLADQKVSVLHSTQPVVLHRPKTLNTRQNLAT